MDWNEIRTNWTELTGSILTRWPDANEDDVLAIDGVRSAFVTYISRLENLPEPEAEDRVSEWAATAMPADARMAPAMVNQAIGDSAASVPPGEDPSDADEAFGDEAGGTRSIPQTPIGRSSE